MYKYIASELIFIIKLNISTCNKGVCYSITLKTKPSVFSLIVTIP